MSEGLFFLCLFPHPGGSSLQYLEWARHSVTYRTNWSKFEWVWLGADTTPERLVPANNHWQNRDAVKDAGKKVLCELCNANCLFPLGTSFLLLNNFVWPYLFPRWMLTDLTFGLHWVFSPGNCHVKWLLFWWQCLTCFQRNKIWMAKGLDAELCRPK